MSSDKYTDTKCLEKKYHCNEIILEYIRPLDFEHEYMVYILLDKNRLDLFQVEW